MTAVFGFWVLQSLDNQTPNFSLDTVEHFVAERLVLLETQVAEEDQMQAEEYGGLGINMSGGWMIYN